MAPSPAKSALHRIRMPSPFSESSIIEPVVVKNLEANYRKVNDVSGATIMGDGRVALILDVGSLVRRSRH